VNKPITSQRFKFKKTSNRIWRNSFIYNLCGYAPTRIDYSWALWSRKETTL